MPAGGGGAGSILVIKKHQEQAEQPCVVQSAPAPEREPRDLAWLAVYLAVVIVGMFVVGGVCERVDRKSEKAQ